MRMRCFSKKYIDLVIQKVVRTLISVKFWVIVAIGNDYEKAVNNRLEKENKAPDFESQSSYCVPISENQIVYKHKENEQHYLRVYPNLCHVFKEVVLIFDANGKHMPFEEFQKWQEEYGTIKTANKNQGLDKPIKVCNYKLENVKWLKQKEFCYDNLDNETKALLAQFKTW